MPDISMCLNSTCPVRFLCYRHEDSGTRPLTRRQSYMDFKPTDEGYCHSIEPIDQKDKIEASLKELKGRVPPIIMKLSNYPGLQDL